MDRNNTLLKAKRRYKVLLREQEQLRKQNRSDSDIDNVIASLLAEFPELGAGGQETGKEKSLNTHVVNEVEKENKTTTHTGNEKVLLPSSTSADNMVTRPTISSSSYHSQNGTERDVSSGNTVPPSNSDSREPPSPDALDATEDRAPFSKTGELLFASSSPSAGTKSSNRKSSPEPVISGPGVEHKVPQVHEGTKESNSAGEQQQQVAVSRLQKWSLSLILYLLSLRSEAHKPSLVGRSTFMRCILTSVALAFVHQLYLDPVKNPAGRVFSPLLFSLLIHLNNVYWLYIYGKGRQGTAMLLVYLFLDFIPSCATVLVAYSLTATVIEYVWKASGSVSI